MAIPQPVVLTQATTNPGTFDPKPLVVVGDLPIPASAVVALTAVPGSFADLAAVRTYLNTLVTEIKSSPYFS